VDGKTKNPFTSDPYLLDFYFGRTFNPSSERRVAGGIAAQSLVLAANLMVGPLVFETVRP
jgi:hypothetical protein